MGTNECFGGDGNVIKLDGGGNCTTLSIYY